MLKGKRALLACPGKHLAQIGGKKKSIAIKKTKHNNKTTGIEIQYSFPKLFKSLHKQGPRSMGRRQVGHVLNYILTYYLKCGRSAVYLHACLWALFLKQ